MNATNPSSRQVRAQVIIWIDDAGVVHCEAPGRNGAREKLDWHIPESMAQELRLRAEESRERERKEAIERHQRVFAQTSREHSASFARKTVGQYDAHLKSALKRDGFTKAEIADMESRGELRNQQWLFSSDETESRRRIREDEQALGRAPASPSSKRNRKHPAPIPFNLVLDLESV